jgi:hypothetical protein
MKLSDDQRAAMMDATKPKTSKRISAPKVSSHLPSAASGAPIGEETLMETTVNLYKTNKPVAKDEERSSYRRGNKKVGIDSFSPIPEEEPAGSGNASGSGSKNGSTNGSARISVSDDLIQIKKEAAAADSKTAPVGSTTKYVPNKSLPSSKGEANRKVTFQSSLKTLMNSMFAVLLIGMVITMSMVVARIRSQGTVWTDDIKHDLRVKIVQNMQSIADAKASYIEVSQ